MGNRKASRVCFVYDSDALLVRILICLIKLALLTLFMITGIHM